MISALGTHKRIPTLSQPVETGEPFSVTRLFKEMFETLSEKSFIALFGANVLFSVALGLNASLVFLLLNYFWEFSEFQIFIWTSLVFFSAALAFFIGPFAVRRLGKKQATIVLGLLAFVIQPMGVNRSSDYAASKAAVNGLTRGAAFELARYQITANALLFGYYETDITAKADPKFALWMEKRIPLRRPGDHAGLEGLAVFFASPHSDYITGQCLPVDGGLCIS